VFAVVLYHDVMSQSYLALVVFKTGQGESIEVEVEVEVEVEDLDTIEMGKLCQAAKQGWPSQPPQLPMWAGRGGRSGVEWSQHHHHHSRCLTTSPAAIGSLTQMLEKTVVMRVVIFLCEECKIAHAYGLGQRIGFDKHKNGGEEICTSCAVEFTEKDVPRTEILSCGES
jgi:hypothetical protein